MSKVYTTNNLNNIPKLRKGLISLFRSIVVRFYFIKVYVIQIKDVNT